MLYKLNKNNLIKFRPNNFGPTVYTINKQINLVPSTGESFQLFNDKQKSRALVVYYCCERSWKRYLRESVTLRRRYFLHVYRMEYAYIDGKSWSNFLSFYYTIWLIKFDIIFIGVNKLNFFGYRLCLRK